MQKENLKSSCAFEEKIGVMIFPIKSNMVRRLKDVRHQYTRILCRGRYTAMIAILLG